jgi:Cys-rich protein (TIGR01571 family)
VHTDTPDSIAATKPAFVPSVANCSGQQVPIHAGDFKYGLCSCTDEKICCQPLWWNAWFLQCIPIAQLLNRFRWSPWGTSSKMSHLQVFGIVVGMYIAYYLCFLIYGALYKCKQTEYVTVYGTIYGSVHCSSGGAGVFFILAGVIFAVSIIIMLVRIRMVFREQYKIKGSCGADILTMWCCSCCSVIQMLRQTHEEDEYNYNCCSCMTGLPENAPEIV